MPEHKSHNLPLESLRQSQYDDEIDLMDLVDVIIRKKNLVFFITVFITLTAVVYSILSPDRYQVEMTVAPVSTRVLEQINVNLDVAFKFTTDEVFKLFLYNFQTLKNDRAGYNALDSLNPDERKKLGMIRIKQAAKKNAAGVANLIIEGRDPQFLTTVLNKYVDAVNRITTQDMINQLEMLRKAEIDALTTVIEKEKKDLTFWQQMRFQELQYALLVARKAGLKKMPGTLPDNYPLYLLGEDFLQAEIEVIRVSLESESIVPITRGEGDKFFDPQRSLLEKQLRLKNLQNENYAFRKTQLVELGVSDHLLGKSLKPGLHKVFIFSLIAGLFIGVFFVFVANFLETYAQRKRNTSQERDKS
ncbi:MAG: Wzz/FepE/Etk N-terminal domain-containing protein [Pseudomonadota bacterium]